MNRIKLDSLRAHKSQLGEGEDFENNAGKWIRLRNAESGQRVGVKYAEFYKVMILQQPNEEDSKKDLEKATAQAQES